MWVESYTPRRFRPALADAQNCNGGFIVPHATRGRGASHALAQAFSIYAPKLGYRASVFNLVYASEP
jgi:hypothetical protein